MSTEMPQAHFLSKLNRNVSFMEIFSKVSKKSCSVVFGNNSMHMATQPIGIIGYIEILISTVKPSLYGMND